MSVVLAPFDCQPPAWRLLSILHEEDGRSISYLAEVGVVERSNLGRLIDDLEQKGLVTRDRHSVDKRQTLVFLSSAGRSLFRRSLPSVLEYYSRLLADISQSELETLMSLLARIKNNVSAPLGGIVDW
jgi:DNA-binding MarR family transcriptional regulator